MATLLTIVPACEHLPDEPASSRPAAIRGITLVDWSPNGYRRASADSALRAIASVGASHLAIIVTAYQSSPAANLIRIDSTRTPTLESVRYVLGRALSLGLKVVVKPHVDLDDGSWRGHITPQNPKAWFESYQGFLAPLAFLAESVNAAQFVIGTELAGTINNNNLWEGTIQFVRTRYHGQITYAASWDEAAKVSFWQRLDFIGIDFYFPVAVRPDPGRLEILSGWQPWIERLHLLHGQTGLKIVLTEIGYPSISGAGMNPYSYGADRPVDLTEQADLYWAALSATSDLDWIAGMYWWDWSADGSGGPQNSDYTPAGKPAEFELSKSWGH
jgi:glycosyl hydrolase family 113